MPTNSGIQKRGVRLEFRAVGDRQLKDIARNMKKVSDNSRQVRRNFSGLRNVFLGVFASRGVASVVRMADSIQLLGDRINAFAGNAKEGAETLDLIFLAANRTNASVDTLAEGFNRVALATQELGLSTEQAVAFTTTLQNAFRIQGASAAESRGAIIQLTQGLASGALRGQELRSVLEASAVAGSVLADAVGITRGQLIKFAETGALTSDVVLKAFADRALELDERAAKLGTTFGQTLTKAANDFKQELNELNRNLELNKVFESSVLELTRSLRELIKVAQESGALATATEFLRDYITTYSDLATQVLGKETPLQQTDQEIASNIDRIQELKQSIDNLKNSRGIIPTILNAIRPEGRGSSRTGNSSTIERLEKEIMLIEDRNELLIKARQGQIRFNQARQDGQTSTPTQSDPIQQLLENFSQSDFQAALQRGALTLDRLNLLFKQGSISIDQYNKSVIELRRQGLQKEFTEGRIELQKYNEQLEDLNMQLARLEGRFNPIRQGARNAFLSIGEFSDEIVGAVENSFSTLEDQLFDFAKTGKFLFNDFAQSVLDDITRIVIRTQLIRPLLDGLGNFSSGTPANNSSVNPSAPILAGKGKVFDRGNVQAFAKGGVVDSPTFFPTNSGTGLMGETGRSEAVLPLERVSGGDLGVKALPSQTIVNINNQTGSEVEIEESVDGNTKVLDITITKAVRNAINQGRLDKALSSSFGLNRKGSR